MPEANRKRPDFKAVREKIKKILALDNLLSGFSEDETAAQEVTQAAEKYIIAEVDKTLKNIPVEELNRDKLGIRVSVLQSAGINTVYDVLGYSEAGLRRIPGIGFETASKIYSAARKIERGATENTKIRLSADNKSKESGELVKSLYVLKNTIPLTERSKEIYEHSHKNIESAVDKASKAKNIFTWILQNGQRKEQALTGLAQIDTMLEGHYANEVTKLSNRKKLIRNTSTESCWKDFQKSAATYNTLLENQTGRKSQDAEQAHGLPAELAKTVEGVPLNTDGLKCMLRGYQKLGAQFVLSQGQVLLGDQMGLGKTVQAIAVMNSLKNDGETHFLVVCPASVLINWYREIIVHSNLIPFLVHGRDAKQQWKMWMAYGGVAVTNYENCSRLELPEDFHYGIIVADEAHYIKNPNALRTIGLLNLKKNTERALFMTGTPIENNVDEMVFLISCLNPLIAYDLEDIKYLSTSKEFREKVAPVYFRRRREDVLQELPDIEESAEWIVPNAHEIKKYAESTENRKFNEMRQISWNVDDIRYSSKAARLLELCDEAKAADRKVIVFSFYLNTLDKVKQILGDRCFGPITGSITPSKRQDIIDKFSDAEAGSVVVCQIQAGGTGLNIQSASVVVFCEPQLKPSIENQAISRAYRMGQSRNVLVYRLLCDRCVDEHIIKILAGKQTIFNEFADDSVSAAGTIGIDETTINQIIDKEIARLNGGRTA